MPTIGPRVNKEARGCASYGLDGNAAGAKSYKRYGFHGDIPAGFIFARAKAREFALHPKPAKSLVNLEFEALKENALLQIPDLYGGKARTLDMLFFICQICLLLNKCFLAGWLFFRRLYSRRSSSFCLCMLWDRVRQCGWLLFE